jgi:arsenite methyltransferase
MTESIAETTTPGGGPHLQILNVDEAVRSRYTEASRQASPDLCCAVTYDAGKLAVLPAELIERDYGCGDPSKHVRPGETVLDLGSGGGKICYIISQVVGPAGRVIGVDVNRDMLALAHKHRETIAAAIGYSNVEFKRGRIQDLALDLDDFDAWLQEHPVRNSDDWQAAEFQAELLRQTRPMIESGSIDVVVSNCVLNLVRETDRRQLFAEIYRVLKPGGRAVISDIVSDQPVPAHLRRDPQLWSGCISGAFEQNEFMAAFERAGFAELEILERQAQPFAVVDGIDFRSLTVSGLKPQQDR